MKIKHFLYLAVFFSVNLNAQESIDLLHTTFKKSDKNYSLPEHKTSNKVIEVTNMPAIRSQETVGICYAFAAATMLQRYWCERYEPNCSATPPEKTISPIGIMFFSNGTENRESFFLKIDGYATSTVLQNSQRLNHFRPEACFPFAEFQKIFGSNDIKIKETLEALRALYRKNKIAASASEDCVECVAKAEKNQFEIRKLLQASSLMSQLAAENLNTVSFLIALKSESFEAYLYQIFDTCNIKTVTKINHKYHGFPDAVGTVSKNQYIDKIGGILVLDTPVMLEGTCLKLKRITDLSEVPFYSKLGYTCSDPHGVVISGLATDCNAGICKFFLRFTILGARVGWTSRAPSRKMFGLMRMHW